MEELDPKAIDAVKQAGRELGDSGCCSGLNGPINPLDKSPASKSSPSSNQPIVEKEMSLPVNDQSSIISNSPVLDLGIDRDQLIANIRTMLSKEKQGRDR